MLNVSDKYLELVQSRIRPKCTPKITVSGIDNVGNQTTLIWTDSNIKNFRYQRATDVLSREMPYMELEWTEIYEGDLNEVAFPEKYKNIVKFMPVDIEFNQNLTMFGSWQEHYGNTWKKLSKLKWRDLLKPKSEIIRFPRLFLEGTPTINGKTITWKAKDLLYFINMSVSIVHMPTRYGNVPYMNFFINILNKAAENWRSAIYIWEALEASIANLQATQEEVGELFPDSDSFIVNTDFKSCILQLASARDYWFQYKLDGSFDLEKTGILTQLRPGQQKSQSIMYENPRITQGLVASLYDYNIYRAEPDSSGDYEVEPSGVAEDGMRYIFVFRGAGVVSDLKPENAGRNVYSTYFEAEAYGADPLIVTPIIPVATNIKKDLGQIGETYIEDNQVKTYDTREEFISNYFKKGNLDIEYTSLPDLSMEPADAPVIRLGIGNGIKKQFIVSSIQLEYDGSYKQKVKAHECEVGVG